MKAGALLLILLCPCLHLLAQTNYTPYVFVTLAGSSAGFDSPRGLDADPHGTVFVPDYNNDTIEEITPAGVVTTIAGLPGVAGTNDGIGASARFNQPRRVVVDKLGNLFVADAFNHLIREITPVGTNWMVTTIAGLAGVSGTNDGIGAAARFKQPSGVALDLAQNLYVADNQNRTIRLLVPVGTNWLVSTIAGLPGVSGSADGTNSTARFAGPINLDLDLAGNIYVADNGNNEIRKITPAGTNWVVTTPAGSTTAGYADGMGGVALFDNPTGVAVDGAGNIYVGDTFNDAIRMMAPVGTNYLVTTLAGVPEQPGYADGAGPLALFNNPRGVAVDVAGNVYVADAGNDAIRKGWNTNTSPVISLDPPLFATGGIEIAFRPVTGMAAGFQLLESGQLTGPWTTNASATLTTNVPNISYDFVAPSNAPSQFYKIQSN
jgi:NHL repeat